MFGGKKEARKVSLFKKVMPLVMPYLVPLLKKLAVKYRPLIEAKVKEFLKAREAKKK